MTGGTQRAVARTSSAGGTTQAAETSRLARRTAINLVGSGVSATVNIALVVLVTRRFGKDVAGSLFAATSLFVVVQTAGRGGGDSALQYFMPRVSGAAGQRRLLRAVLTPLLGLWLLSSLVLLVWAGVVRHGASDLGHAATAPYLTVLAVFVPVAVGYDLLLACSRALSRAKPTVLLEQIARPLCQLLLTTTVVATGRVDWLALAWAAPYLLTFVPAFRAAQPRPDATSEGSPLGASPEELPPETVTHKAIWRFSAPRALAALSQIAIQRLDIVLVAALRGVRDAAVYTAATRFLVLGQLVNQAIALPLQPRLGVLMARADLRGADDLFAVATSWTVALAWPLYLSFAVYSGPSLRIFGHGYTQAADVVVLLSLAMLVATACGPVDLMLIMAGRTAWNLANTVASFTVFLTADLLLIPDHGPQGAAIGWALAILTNNLLPLFQVRHRLHCWPLRRPALTIVVVSPLCFAAVPLALRAVLGAGWPAFALGATLGTAIYLGALWRLRQPLRVTGVRWRGGPQVV